MTTLLPPNATQQERAIEGATTRISDVPVRVRQMWSPDDCPAALLPWLAWAMSVDSWENTWTEQQKRDTIKASFYVHRRKGTVAAVRAAIAALGLGLRVIEWFEETPAREPYTFRLTLDIDQTGVSLEELLKAVNVVNASKNLRSHLAGVDVTAITRTTVTWAGAAMMGSEITINPAP